MTVDVVKIGKLTVDMESAKDWVRGYTDVKENRSAADPYAYPAYDDYGRDSNIPGTLADSDLLAPVLLNVGISIRSYYGLQSVSNELESVLADDDLANDLADLSDEKIISTTTGIYKVLDGNTAPFGVGGTKLSKIVHRKRPSSLALHDKWVRACYVGPEGPVPLVPKREKRSWAEYMGLISLSIAADLRSQRDTFQQLQNESLATSPRLTNLRLLDIFAWHRGQGA